MFIILQQILEILDKIIDKRLVLQDIQKPILKYYEDILRMTLIINHIKKMLYYFKENMIKSFGQFKINIAKLKTQLDNSLKIIN